MPKATYILPDGSQRTLDLRDGQSLMEAAIRNGIGAILGECGGSAMCATCHCYVENAPVALPPVGADEDAMLEETAAPREANSRLSCQIRMTPALDGIAVRIPAEM
ncbi:2Fe-2S iron-sulfur cluster-binding protein [Pararhodobacter marinus]|uniref:2Fe-2S iron-sulfur cluster-binding protein n=1 Tax=Pararhodobacter marinus TaxID=2184063 RepID=UPI0035150D11